MLQTHTHNPLSAHINPTLFSPPTAFPFPAWLGGGCPVCQSISRLRARHRGRRAGSQSGGVVEGRGVDACVREALSHISPGGWQQAGSAEGGSPLSHDLSGSCAHLGAIHFLPEHSLPLQLQGGGDCKGTGGSGRGVWLPYGPRVWYSKLWA